jgi:hypothetical protein
VADCLRGLGSATFLDLLYNRNGAGDPVFGPDFRSQIDGALTQRLIAYSP